MIGGLTHLLFRYFFSGPLPTEPAALPRPPPKKESVNSKGTDFTTQDSPTVLSPPRKSRRVMPNREGIERDVTDRMDDHGNDIRQAAGERSERADMSLDFTVFGTRPPVRPTINR